VEIWFFNSFSCGGKTENVILSKPSFDEGELDIYKSMIFPKE